MARLLTYNVHRCVGTDRRLDVARIADVIAEQQPDIVCLQELDVGRARTGGIDQAAEIAQRLSMSFRFNAALRIEAEEYGDAILTTLPERLIKAGPLPSVRGVPGLEPRGAVWIEVEIDGQPVNVVTTHLGLVPREQRLQAAALMSRDWLGSPDRRGPIILAGDFNATSITRPYQRIARHLFDAQRLAGKRPSLKTFPSSFAAIRIDHVFVSGDVRVSAVQVPNAPLVRAASDHLPLIVDFGIQPRPQ